MNQTRSSLTDLKSLCMDRNGAKAKPVNTTKNVTTTHAMTVRFFPAAGRGVVARSALQPEGFPLLWGSVPRFSGKAGSPAVTAVKAAKARMATEASDQEGERKPWSTSGRGLSHEAAGRNRDPHHDPL